MPRGAAPPWKARAPHTEEARPYFLAAVGVPRNTPLLWTGLKSRADVKQMIRGLYNNATRHDPAVSMPMPEVIENQDGTFTIKFYLVDKEHGRAHVVTTYGEDRSGWPYDPRKKGRD